MDKKKILDILDYWYFLDFLNQDNWPKAKRQSGKIKLTEKQRRLAVETNLSNERQEGIVPYCARRVPEGKTPSQIKIYAGKVHKRLMTQLLLEITGGRASDYEFDGESKGIALLQMEVLPSGELSSVRQSPLLWVLSKLTSGKIKDLNSLVLSEKEYTSDQQEVFEAIKQKMEDRECRFPDIKSIVDEYARKVVESAERICGKGESNDLKGLDEIVLEMRWSANEQDENADDDELSNAFGRNFFVSDLSALRAAIAKSDSVDDLLSSNLGLAMSYLRVCSDETDYEAKRINIFDASTDEKRETLSRLYGEMLDFDNYPLGKWPSTWDLSLMQQFAVNMVAGRKESPQFPANDIMSVNGPPGTGKTTLIKDVVASRIVEKARILLEYKNADDLFQKVDFEYAPGGRGRGYLTKHYECVYKIKDDRVTDLGIVLCSFTNKAVENISRSLPNVELLLNGISSLGENESPQAKEAIERERSLFLGENEDCFFVERGETAYPDTYFSIAADSQSEQRKKRLSGEKGDRVSPQFKIPEDYYENHSPGLLITACLGGDHRTADFVENVLGTIPYTKRRNRAGQLQRAREGFESQLKRVKNHLNVLECRKKALESTTQNLEKATGRVCTLQQNLNENRRVYDTARSDLLELLRRDGSPSFLENEDPLAAAQTAISVLRKGNSKKVAEKSRLESDLSSCESDLNSAKGEVEALREELDRAAGIRVLHRKNLQKKYEAAVAGLEKSKCDRANARQRLVEFDYANPNLSETIKLVESLESSAEKLRRLDEQRLELEKAIACEEARKGELESELASALDASPKLVNWNDAVCLLNDGAESGERAELQLYNPAADFDLSRERDLLFYWALQFTREFILSSERAMSNVKNLYAMCGGAAVKIDSNEKGRVFYDARDVKNIKPYLLQTLNLIVPVITTTFSSFGSVFGDVAVRKTDEKAPFGLLIVDESGQVEPHCVIGAMARCRKALIVGDPLQLQPVADEDLKVIRSHWDRCVPGRLGSVDASLQSIADCQNPYGYKMDNHTEDGEEEKGMWLGCPLLVHRRCASPMFEICNELSYDNIMVNQTGHPSQGDFYYPSSKWINVSGCDAAKGKRYSPQQAEFVKKIVVDRFSKCPRGSLPDLFVITPFANVKEELQSFCRPSGIDDKTWEAFKEDNIGTVHTFQGKEAREVVFVIGAGENTEFINERHVNKNLVNVAVSRARQRLYVIGDYSKWADNRAIRLMKKRLDTAWVPYWEKWRVNNDDQSRSEALRRIPSFDSSEESDTYFESFASNVDDRLQSLRLLSRDCKEVDDEICQRFGFGNVKEIEKAVSGCNKAPMLLKQGIMLCNLFGVDELLAGGKAKLPEDIDLGFLTMGLTKAEEAFLRKRLDPSLEAISDDKGSKKKAKRMLGNIANDVKNNAYEIGLRCRILEETNCGPEPVAAYCSKQWWSSFGRLLAETASEDRNPAVHGDDETSIGADEIRATLFRLFGNPDENVSPYDRGVFHQGAALAAFQEASALEIDEACVARATQITSEGESAVKTLGAFIKEKEAEGRPFSAKIKSGLIFARTKGMAEKDNGVIAYLLCKNGYLIAGERGERFRVPTLKGAIFGLRWKSMPTGNAIYLTEDGAHNVSSNLLEWFKKAGILYGEENNESR